MPASISHLASSPTPIALNQLVHATSTGAEIDYFSLPLESGQSVRVELVAQQIDSWMIGQLEVVDPRGKIVVTARGSDGFDPSLEFNAEQAGNYRLAVHDFLYRGGGEFFYQLTARVGEQAAVDLIGSGNLPRWTSPPSVTLPKLEPGGVVSDSGVQPITPPCVIRALFDTRDDEDVYEFTATEGDQYAIELLSHRIGQPTDPRLAVLRGQPQPSGDPTFQQLLMEDDSQNVGGSDLSLLSKDPVAMFKAPATGSYRIVVRDLDNGETLGQTQQYVLVIRTPMPRFDLLAYRPFPDKDTNQSRNFGSKLFRGGSEAIRILAVRHDGWSGPIEISVNGLPAGVRCPPATIAANQKETQVSLVASDDAAAWSGAVEVTGKAVVNGQEMVRTATPAVISGGRAHSRDFVHSRLSFDLLISVSDADVAPVSTQVGDQNPLEVKKGASLQLPIKLTRRDGGKAACVLRPRDLPPGVTAGDVTIAADKAEGTLELKVAANAAVGIYSLWLQAETKIKVKPNPQALQRAEQYRSHLQQLKDDPTQAANLESITAAITLADGRVEAAKAAAKEQELTVYIPSPHVTIRVVDP